MWIGDSFGQSGLLGVGGWGGGGVFGGKDKRYAKRKGETSYC